MKFDTEKISPLIDDLSPLQSGDNDDGYFKALKCVSLNLMGMECAVEQIS